MNDAFAFKFDLISFLLGFVGATLFWWLFLRSRKWAPLVLNAIKKQVELLREQNFINVDRYIRLDALKRAQKNHIASKLFSLDEIIIEPRLLVPDGENEIEDPHNIRTQASISIPYAPDWPEVTSQYPYPSISLLQAVKNHANLMIIGTPGSGKTVALAHLASQLSKIGLEDRQQKHLIPIYLHVNDFGLPKSDEEDALACLVGVISQNAPAIIQKRIPTFFKENIRSRQFILILDGLDEVHPQLIPSYVRYLKSLTQHYQKIQVVTAVSTLYFDGLISERFIPMTLATWSQREREEFITKWGELWSGITFPVLSKNNVISDINSVILNHWVNTNNISLTPLEWTLKLWALYAGDLIGNTNLNAIHSYLLRLSNKIIPIQALQYLASQYINDKQAAVPYERIDSRLSKTSWPEIPSPTSQMPQTGAKTPAVNRKSKRISSVGKAVDALIDTGLLQESPQGLIGFSHPVILGYLASFDSELEGAIPDQSLESPVWAIQDLVEHYQAAQGGSIELVQRIIFNPEPPLYSNLLRICRWIKDVPVHMDWRNQFMRQLVQLIHRQDLPFGIRTRLLSGILITNDSSVPTLMKSLLSSTLPWVRQMAALGCGAIQIDKSLEGLTNLLADAESDNQITAAFAIGIINSPAAIKICEEMIKSDEENISQVAAESLANKPIMGHEILRSTAESSQILARRAAVIGLALTREEWAYRLIEKIAVEDGQWVVRNVAGQVLEFVKNRADYIPSSLPLAHESPWLLAFASKLGTGIPIGQPALEILVKALQSGTPVQKIAALRYLSVHQDNESLAAILQSISTETGEISQAALNTLWLIKTSGKKINS